MKIAELLRSTSKRKRTRVDVRVPTKLQEKLGATARGTVQRIMPKGSITWVEVKIGRKTYRFRPQDLSLAA